MTELFSRAYRIAADGERSQGTLTTLPIQEIGGGELLIRTSYSSVNYKDALAATGTGKVVRRFPLVGGIDLAGVVASSADHRFAEGDRVVVTGFGLSEDHDGGYSEWARVPADWAVPIPEGLSEWESMALGTAGLTAALAIHQLEHNGLTPGSGPIAVTGATGGVGSLAVGMLARLGYDVTAFTGKDSAHAYLRKIGAATVEDRPPVEQQTRPLESGRWAGAIDSVGGDTLAWLTRTTKRHGSIAAFGNAGGHELRTTVMPFILRGINLLGINTGYFSSELRHHLWQRMSDELRPTDLETIARTIEFDELPNSFDQFLNGQVRGRVVVKIKGRTES